ncbi:glycosyltransferase family 61 protein [Methylobacterium indicum]|uniref:glycosyltransferase family 61 protein n=1 Tax=Methylobacterium indicum TaxID=1775910 RepID=UPI0024358A8D|nr:glycosyltransferase family 61 protein [Methylobacterium indicum]
MHDILRAVKCLSEEDKQKLSAAWEESYQAGEACLRSMSIFSDKSTHSQFGDFKFEHVPGDVYYIGKLVGDLGIFVDSEKKPIFNSKYYLSHLRDFLEIIDSRLEILQQQDFSNAIDIGSDYVSIGKWFVTYGHFKDEAYSVGHFLEQFPDVSNFRAILDYPNDAKLDHASFKHNLNYLKIEKLIFGENSINAYNYGNRPLKLRNLYLINNNITAKIFHSFPPSVSAKIRANIKSQGVEPPIGAERSKRVFLTRSSSYRDIANKSEVEAIASRSGFAIVNPEEISYEEMVSILGYSESVIMYYGSALTNLVYMSPGTNVYILKSQSYMHESLELWKKIINNYKLNLREIFTENNFVSRDQFEGIVHDDLPSVMQG